MNKVELGSVIRLDDLHNFRVIHQDPSWKEINQYKTPRDHVIRMVNETVRTEIVWTKSSSISRLGIQMVQGAVAGLFEDIELVSEE